MRRPERKRAPRAGSARARTSTPKGAVARPRRSQRVSAADRVALSALSGTNAPLRGPDSRALEEPARALFDGAVCGSMEDRGDEVRLRATSSARGSTLTRASVSDAGEGLESERAWKRSDTAPRHALGRLWGSLASLAATRTRSRPLESGSTCRGRQRRGPPADSPANSFTSAPAAPRPRRTPRTRHDRAPTSELSTRARSPRLTASPGGVAARGIADAEGSGTSRKCISSRRALRRGTKRRLARRISERRQEDPTHPCPTVSASSSRQSARRLACCVASRARAIASDRSRSRSISYARRSCSCNRQRRRGGPAEGAVDARPPTPHVELYEGSAAPPSGQVPARSRPAARSSEQARQRLRARPRSCRGAAGQTRSGRFKRGVATVEDYPKGIAKVMPRAWRRHHRSTRWRRIHDASNRARRDRTARAVRASFDSIARARAALRCSGKTRSWSRSHRLPYACAG